MFSRRGLFKYLPAFLVPAALKSAKIEEPPPIQFGPTDPTGITHAQLQAIAVSIPLPELKILIENLEKIQVPSRYRRQDEPLSKFQYNFPSGKQTWHDHSEIPALIQMHEEEAITGHAIIGLKNKI